MGASIFVHYILKQSSITLDILMSDGFVDSWDNIMGTFASARHLPQYPLPSKAEL
jgi:hypothetical protein